MSPLLPLHLLTLAYVAWTIFHADHMAFKWIRGKVNVLDKETVKKYHRHTWYGLCGMIATGFLLFWPMRDYLLSRPQFYVKMAFVVTLIANGFVIGRLQDIATKKWFKELTLREKLPLFVSGAISTACWTLAAVSGFYIVEDF